ncbi:MAG TPA: mannose-6-phosphate isomerase, class I, partial [Micromonosporaceae bacterium]|nr:mannose-6-phosphate isomerase, class I [Micromonosporaceae bacterium]
PLSLAALVEADPEGTLGAEVAARFGARLPFLLKLLAAAEPLSLQAHPDAERARERHAAGDPSYVDPYHKPELMVAVSEFDALCGFRQPALAADSLAALAVPKLDPVVSLLRGGDLRAAVAALLGWPAGERPDLVKEVAAAAVSRAELEEYAMVGRLAASYPDDVGVVVALLLNHVRLRPGEAIWMPAGNLHAYLSGTGMEIMATSDNVLRGGLTPKRVDVPELLRVLRFAPLADPLVRPEAVAPGVVTWPTPATEFKLFRVDLGGSAGPATAAELRLDGPRTVFCLDGGVTVDDGSPLALSAGAAAFGPAGRPLRLTGAGTAFVATTNT